MEDLQAPLRNDVRLLGDLLGQSIGRDQGQPFLDKLEQIRQLSKAARRGEADIDQLVQALQQLDESELVPTARAFGQFLNLANLAEEYHRIRRRKSLVVNKPDPQALDKVFDQVIDTGISPEQLAAKAAELRIDLILRLDTGRIDQKKSLVMPARVSGHPVPGRSSYIADNRYSLANEAVE